MKITVIGLGYVGLGLAVALSKHHEVIGYDICQKRVQDLKDGIETNAIIPEDELKKSSLYYTDILDEISESNIYILTVSTPAFYYELPDLDALVAATKSLASIIKKGDIVIYESTVYPGTTEDVCLPLLEEVSGLKSDKDFHIAYSPERICPGDENHSLSDIAKVVSAQNKATLEIVSEIYRPICKAIFPVSNIKTAEAVKILENTQRDVNIAFMNEFTQIMHALDLNMHEIIEAAKTKWSFIPFKPGFVGGHCIAVDPQYLVFKAKRMGMHPDVILASRKVNEGMPQFVIQSLIRLLINANVAVKNAKIGIFGLAYKENVKDARNSLALKLVKFLEKYDFTLQIHDPMVEEKIIKKKYGHTLLDFSEVHGLTAIILVVGHDYYREVGLEQILTKFTNTKILLDIPNLFVNEQTKFPQLIYWNL